MANHLQQSQISDFIEECKTISLQTLFFIDNPIALCKLPYPGHKKGCPNVGKNKNCPPLCPKVNEKYNLSKPYFFSYVKFNLKKQKEKMKLLHPDWTAKQCKCLLYWQGTVRKKLNTNSKIFTYDIKEETGYWHDYELIPEAMGVDVFKTMKCHGIKLERNPENYVYKVSFIGALNDSKN